MTTADTKATLSFSDGSPSVEFPIYKGTVGPEVIDIRKLYGATGKLVEKYDVVTTGKPGGGGEYPTQDGFGWTNGVMRKLMALYPSYSTNTSPQVCGLNGS